MPPRWVEPFAAALALRDEPGLVLLESMPGFGHLGRRSFLAARPLEVQTDGLSSLAQPVEELRAGWLSYDLGREVESLPSVARDELGLPPLALGRYPGYLEFDHVRRHVHLRGVDPGPLARALDSAPADPPAHVPLRAWTSTLARPQANAISVGSPCGTILIVLG